MERREEELDPDQQDSPYTRRTLEAHGVTDPNTASPGFLRRTLHWLTGTTPAQTIEPRSLSQPESELPRNGDARNERVANPVPIPVALAEESAPPPVSLSLPPQKRTPPVLAPPPQPKRTKMENESKAQATARCRANPWWCTCQVVWPSKGGRPWHVAGCPRKLWDDTGGAHMPIVGTRVTVMACAGPRRGEVWECERVHKHGWKLVDVVGSESASGVGSDGGTVVGALG